MLPILAIAGALDLNRLSSLQREWAIQFRELLRRDQPLGLAAQIHNHAEVEKRYFLESGIFPIMHTVVIRQDVYERNRWVAREMRKPYDYSFIA